MQKYIGFLCLIAICQSALVFAEESAESAKNSPRKILQRCALRPSWPGSGLWHTAFNRECTTRFLLLRCSTKTKELVSWLKLSDEQLQTVAQLRPVAEVDRRIELSNDEPDEEVFDPKYFSFLSDQQRLKLDMLAMQYDGYFALTRRSLASAAKLSDESQAKIAKIVATAREEYVLPKFRWEFAARLPDDYQYEKMLAEGSYAAYVNLQIVDVLSDGECERLTKLLSDHSAPREVEQSLRALIKLPQGFDRLAGEDKVAEGKHQ